MYDSQWRRMLWAYSTLSEEMTAMHGFETNIANSKMLFLLLLFTVEQLVAADVAEISYVLETFETPEKFLGQGDVVLNDTTAFIGQGFLRISSLDEKEDSSAVPPSVIATHFGNTTGQAHLCQGASRISIWYRHAGWYNVSMQLFLYDSSSCSLNIVSDDCLQTFTSAVVVLENNVRFSFLHSMYDDWHEVSWSFLDDNQDWNTSDVKSLKYIHGWEIHVVEQTSNSTFTSVLDGFTLDLDHLACYGGPELFQSLSMVSASAVPEHSESYFNWQYMTHNSEIASNESVISLNGNGAIEFDYTVQKTENWGGFTSIVCNMPGYFNLSSVSAISFDYIVHEPADPPKLVALRLNLDEQFQECELCTEKDSHERFYSFHYILDDATSDTPKTITLPLEGGPNSDAPFWFTGWSAAVDDSILDKSRLRVFMWEFSIIGATELYAIASGRIEILNFRVETDSITSLSDDKRYCEAEPSLTLTSNGFSQAKLRFGVSDCCGECEKDKSCLFALKSERKHCAIVSDINPRLGKELRLSSNSDAVHSNDTSYVSWINTVEITGDFCGICSCVENKLLIDCRGKNLLTIPQSFSNVWLPRVLDLRDNPSLAIIGNRALSSISESLDEIYFPANLRYLSPTAFQTTGNLDLVVFEEFNVLNVMDENGMFGDICCVEGSKHLLTDGRSITFCDHQGATNIGSDALFLPFREFTEYFIIAELGSSSMFMSEAAESPELCAEYCKLNPQCFYFQHDARSSRTGNACFHFSQASNLTGVDEFSDPDLRTPGIIAGVAPRARGVFENARVFVSHSELQANKTNTYTVMYQVMLGSTPQRGVVWVEPMFVGDNGLNISVAPKRASLRRIDEQATFTVRVENYPSAGNMERKLVLNNNVTSCDVAFSRNFVPGDELLVTLTVTIDNPSTGLSLALIMGLAIAMTLMTAGICFVAARKLEDHSWRVDLHELTFSNPPVVLGRGTFGLVVLAEWRGTDVAVKRVLPAEENDDAASSLPVTSGISNISREFETGKSSHMRLPCRDCEMGRSSHMSLSSREFEIGRSSGKSLPTSKLSDSGSRLPGSGAMFKGRGSAKLRSDFISEMRIVSRLRHPNITTVMGAVVRGPEPLLIMELMDHGSLYDIIHNESMPLEADLILPILRDIAQGMRFLHVNNPPIIHGDLKAANCLVDSHFRAKVSDFGLTAKQTLGVSGTPFWMDPVLLRGEARNSRETDVYSFGIMLFEVYAREEPFDGEPFETVLSDVCNPAINKRPPVPPNTPAAIASLMQECHSSTHAGRPSFEEIDKRLRRIDADQVEPGESRFSSQQKKFAKNEDLLHKVFPKHVADALRDGRAVEPDRKDLVTIFFSDIVGFTEISTKLSAHKVTDMLNRFYWKLDALAEKYSVFKIDVIGDSYMCATNLVSDQSTDHVKRIAEFSIEAVAAASETLIDNDCPTLGCIQIRCGFHSGPVVAQVVGRSSPKYSVFGDAVNTASRMESSSLVGYIQCSGRSAEILAIQDPTIALRSRGLIAIKGKGRMETFFVNPPALLGPDLVSIGKQSIIRPRAKSLRNIMEVLHESFSSSKL